MKKTLLIGWGLLCAYCAMAQITGVHANDARLVFVGRTHVDSTSVSADWTGTYLRLHFYGNYLALRLSDTGCNYYNLYIDRDLSAEPDRVLMTKGDTTIVLYEARRPKEHTLTLYKRTEGEQGRTTFHEVLLQGELLDAVPLKERQIEFIGDSYACGYGAENSGPYDPFTPQTETSAKTYASIIARYFKADYQLIAHSGMGIVRNYNSKFAGWYMPDRYTQTFDMDSTIHWSVKQSAFRPQMTVVFLGGNDFSTGMQPNYTSFAANYIRLMQQIKSNYGPEHPILCCTKKGFPDLTDYVQRVVQECGFTNVSVCHFFPEVFADDASNLGAGWHPNYMGHRKAAHVLIPYIATITGWGLQDSKIE